MAHFSRIRKEKNFLGIYMKVQKDIPEVKCQTTLILHKYTYGFYAFKYIQERALLSLILHVSNPDLNTFGCFKHRGAMPKFLVLRKLTPKILNILTSLALLFLILF